MSPISRRDALSLLAVTVAGGVLVGAMAQFAAADPNLAAVIAQAPSIEAPSVVLKGRAFAVTVKGASVDSTLMVRVGDAPAVPHARWGR